jgi:hypothetical protein
MDRWLRVAAVVLWWGVALAPAVAVAQTPEMEVWYPDDTHVVTSYRHDGVSLQFRREGGNWPAHILLTLAKRGVPTYKIRLNGDVVRVIYAITPIDPRHAERDVLVIGDTEGDCCVSMAVFSLIHGHWRDANFGDHVEDATLDEEHVPTVDAQGRAIFRLLDARFYVFGPHCCTPLPMRVLAVENGQVVDLSTDPSFAAVFTDQATSLKEDCVSQNRYRNPSCAAYTAVAARLGQFAEAWEVMLKHYNRNADWDLSFCLDAEFANACRHWSPATRSLPQALAPFLEQRGYIDQTQRDWAKTQTFLESGKPS